MGKQVIRLLIADCYLLSQHETYLRGQQFSESGFERFSKETEWKFYFELEKAAGRVFPRGKRLGDRGKGR